ncbi:threonine ammonia-lyase [Roseospirillum parvum]|uniref:Threonine dehydratase n=1 Tax=Roseospirillum parvum TaxID=83401 RepID=A0A1G7YFA8_9PROT|nr:threonine/serine dehydratase [Roseospirillum parvum]SDG95123.1 threonine dehydratase [Roseospirillum parvum]
MTRPPSHDRILAAADRLAGLIGPTPLLPSPALAQASGAAAVWLKVEALQHTGSFKLRGASNRLALIPEESRPAGVVTCSSGNHAQAVAWAAARLGMPAAIVMPTDAPPVKRQRTEALGAEIHPYDRWREDREALARALTEARGATFVHPYEDPEVIAGQGTVGLELVAQCRAANGQPPQTVLVPCGGGGLSAGVALAVDALAPGCRVLAVEPEGLDDTARSLRAGRRLANPPEARSICDALLAPEPGALTFSLNRALLAGGLAVGDGEVRRAMGWLFREHRVVAEPGGVVGVAALLARRLEVTGQRVVVVVSGGNVDPTLYAEVLGEMAGPAPGSA